MPRTCPPSAPLRRLLAHKHCGDTTVRRRRVLPRDLLIYFASPSIHGELFSHNFNGSRGGPRPAPTAKGAETVGRLRWSEKDAAAGCTRFEEIPKSSGSEIVGARNCRFPKSSGSEKFHPAIQRIRNHLQSSDLMLLPRVLLAGRGGGTSAIPLSKTLAASQRA